MKKGFGKIKMFIMRALSYAAIINGAMILFLVLAQLEKYNIDIDITKTFFPILLVGIFGLGIFGLIEDKLGLHEAERHAQEQRNPYMKEIIERLERIEKRVKKLK